jgi:DNA-binding SARP family transcriptional activator
MISCRTLGPVEVTVDGSDPPAELLWRKNLALLIYLARSPNRSRAREHLTALLWGDRPEPAARHSLREAIRVLRRSLGDDALQADGDVIRLDPKAVQLDTERFEALEATGDVRDAANLVAGEFLEGFSVPDASDFEDWLAVERASWRSRGIAAVVRSSETWLARGDVAAASHEARRATVLDPTADTAIRAVMRAQALFGDRAGALARFEQFTARVRQLGTEPDDETQTLAERVRHQRQWTLPETVPQDDRHGAELRRAPLVGRERELEQLLTVWHACVQNQQATVTVIEADPGVGKTRLAEELLERARLEGAAVAAVRAMEADSTRPSAGILGIAQGGLLNAKGVAGAMPDALAAFAGAIPEWADRFGLPDRAGGDLGRALADVGRALAEEQPLLLFTDDAQWCDHESLVALTAIMRDLNSRPVLVCFALSPQPPRSELDDLRSRIGRDVHGIVIRLDRLDDEAMRRLARWAVPSYDDAQLDRLARRVGSDSAGLPLLAVELLHAVALGLDLEQIRGAWPEPFRTLSHTLPGDLPDAIVAAIRMGFRRLSAPAQRALAAASVLPEPTPTEQLGAAATLGGPELDQALDELEWQRWLTADSRGYSFVARIVRDVTSRDMLTAGQKERILRSLPG